MVAPLTLLVVVVAVVVFGSAGDARGQANVTNAYTTGGTISSGTTNVITNPTTAITGAITNNGSLQFWQSLSLTDSYVISGAGSLVHHQYEQQLHHLGGQRHSPGRERQREQHNHRRCRHGWY
jgi:hypothetical protein